MDIYFGINICMETTFFFFYFKETMSISQETIGRDVHIPHAE